MSVPRLPTGTVTFLFTDIEGSTRLWQRQPEGMKAALARHHEILKHAIESSGGYVFQIVGDAFCAAFHTVSAGVGSALAAQRALASEPWSDATPIRVRMAVHTGTAEVHAGEHKSGEYVSGLTLSHAARLLSVGYGGQILVQTAAQQMLHDDGAAQVELRDLGVHRLRDIAGAEHIFQVVAPGLPTAFPALASLETVPSNLARQLTSFVGRKREIAEVQRLLAETRLLTLTGPGGSGKTRLALETASGLLASYPGGVLAADDGDHARARSLFEESVPLFEVIQDRRGLSHALVSLGGILTKQGDDRRAETLYGRSLALAEELGDKHAVATALRSLGAAAHHRQDHARARSFYEDSVARFREMNDSFCLAQSLVGFALAAHDAGDRERAGTLGDEGLALLRANDARGELASSLERLGRAVLGHRDVGRAARFFGENLRLWVDAQNASDVATSLEGLARVAEARQRPAVVVRLLAAAETWRQARGARRSDADRNVCDRLGAAARAQLDPSAAETAWSEGVRTSMGDTIACAQQLIDSSSP